MCYDLFRVHFICGHVENLEAIRKYCGIYQFPNDRCARPGFRRPKYWEYIRLPNDNDLASIDQWLSNVTDRRKPGWCHSCATWEPYFCLTPQERDDDLPKEHGGIAHVSLRQREEATWDRLEDSGPLLFTGPDPRYPNRLRFRPTGFKEQYSAQLKYENTPKPKRRMPNPGWSCPSELFSASLQPGQGLKEEETVQHVESTRNAEIQKKVHAAKGDDEVKRKLGDYERDAEFDSDALNDEEMERVMKRLMSTKA